jgi:hypothetical protein
LTCIITPQLLLLTNLCRRKIKELETMLETDNKHLVLYYYEDIYIEYKVTAWVSVYLTRCIYSDSICLFIIMAALI